MKNKLQKKIDSGIVTNYEAFFRNLPLITQNLSCQHIIKSIIVVIIHTWQYSYYCVRNCYYIFVLSRGRQMYTLATYFITTQMKLICCIKKQIISKYNHKTSNKMDKHQDNTDTNVSLYVWFCTSHANIAVIQIVYFFI